MPRSNFYGLILAGGRGTRFWPRSRRSRSKQVLSFFGDRTLIQQTVDRLKPVLPPERIWILTNESLRDEIVRQLPEVPRKQVLAEPAQRNTAPCIGLAAHVLHSVDSDSVMGVFPADHVITKPAKFIRVLRAAFKSADRGQITILGIQPRWPDTAYGYIEFPDGVQPGTAGLQPVRSFREKPNKQTAKKLVAAKRFYWNAGMFFWRTDVALAALRDHQLKTWALLAGLPAFGTRRFGASVAAAFPHCESISIDRGVIEKAKNVVGIPMPDIGWNDVGSWDAVYELLSRDGDGNAAVSELLAYESSGSLVDARGKLVALLGVRDLIIVDTDDALLIADRARAQEVAKLVESLEKRGLDRLL